MTTRGRVFLIGGLALLVLLLAIPVGWFALGKLTTDGMGSMSEAVKLRPMVAAMPAPTKSYVDSKTETVGLVFPNGEWVIGAAKDSHALYSRQNGGGTVVLKDSRGRVRCFFGHVCGSGNFMQANDAKSLDEFDSKLSPLFAEQPWP